MSHSPALSLEALYPLVTAAIWHAEQLEEQGDSSALLVWAQVSLLEEEVSTALPLSHAEGRIARRGAVRAALKARDHVRAHALVERYLAEKDAPDTLRVALQEILGCRTWREPDCQQEDT